MVTCLLLGFLHYPEMGKAQCAQGSFLEKLQDGTQEFPEGRHACDDIIVRAEDNRALHHSNRQAVKQARQVSASIDVNMGGKAVSPGSRQIVYQGFVAEVILPIPVDAVRFKGIAAIGDKQHQPPTRPQYADDLFC